METVVHVVVTCTNRKTVPPARSRTLRTVPGATIAARSSAWIGRLRDGTGENLPAERLYAGDHWHVVRSLAGLADEVGLRVEVWICSAGYGLIPLSARIRPYSATFSPNQADSVDRGIKRTTAQEARRQWWKELASWEGPCPGAPRSVAALITEHPISSVMLAVSAPYLDALSDDLEAALALPNAQDKVAIFCAGASERASLSSSLVPCDARLQGHVGGARSSLNVRLIRLALTMTKGGRPDVASLRALFSRLLRRQPELRVYNRSQMTDQEVRDYIRKAIAREPAARPTPLLRCLRDSGLACEHRRFSTLFREVEEARHG